MRQKHEGRESLGERSRPISKTDSLDEQSVTRQNSATQRETERSQSCIRCAQLTSHLTLLVHLPHPASPAEFERLCPNCVQQKNTRQTLPRQQEGGLTPRPFFPRYGLTSVLRVCQNNARRYGQPLFDAVLARLLVRGAYGLDTTLEFDLARKLAALNAREEVWV